MNLIQNFVKSANDRSIRLKKGFETSVEPTQCSAEYLPDVLLEIVNKNRDNKLQREFANHNKFNMLYRSICDFNSYHGNWKPFTIRLGIMYPRNSRKCYKQIVNHLNDFLSRRYV